MKTRFHILGVVVALVALMGIGAIRYHPTPSHAQTQPPIERLVWSPDSTHLAAVTASSIYWANVATGAISPMIVEDSGWLATPTLFSPDNSRLVAAMRLYDTATGDLVAPLTPLDTSLGITALAFSPDSRWLVVGGLNTQFYVVDATTGTPVLEARDGNGEYVDDDALGFYNKVKALAFAPDGSRLYLSDATNYLVVWDTTTWEIIGTATNFYSEFFTQLTLNADGTRLLSRDYNNFPLIWDAATLENLTPDNYRGYRSFGDAFWPDGRTVTIMPDDNRVPWLYDLEAGAWIEEVNFGELLVRFNDEVRSTLHPNGVLVYADDLTPVTWVNILTGETFTSPTTPTTASAFSPDGQWVALAEGGAVTLWNGATQQGLLATPDRPPQPLSIDHVLWSPDGSHLAAIADWGVYWLDTADLNTEPLFITLDATDTSAHAISPDNSRLAIMSQVFDTSTGQLAYTLGSAATTGDIRAVAFSPDSRWVVGGSNGVTLLVADAQTGETVAAGMSATGVELASVGTADYVASLAFSPDGTRLAVGDSVGHLALWDTATWDIIATATNLEPIPYVALTFAADSTRLFSKDGSTYIAVWDATTLENLTPPSFRLAASYGHTFLADGRAVVMMPRDLGEPRLFDLAALALVEGVNFGDLVYHLFDNPQSIVHPDGTLIYWDNRGTAFTWLNIYTGETRLSEDISTGVNALSPDGQWLAYSAAAGTVSLWDGATTQVVTLPPQ